MTEWVSVHVFHHGDLDRVITGLVGPLFREATGPAGFASSSFFLRYWEGGNHVRVRLAVRAQDRAEVTEAVLRRCRAYLTAHPSLVDADAAGYAAFAARVAEWEGVPAFERELRPNNTAWPVAYRPEHDRYGHGAALAAAERHFAESSALALAVLGRSGSPGTRGILGFSLLLSAWLGSGASVEKIVSRQAFRPDAAIPGGVDLEDWEERYQRQRGILDTLRQEIMTTASGEGVLARWRRSLAGLHEVLTAEIEKGNFIPPERRWEGATGPIGGTLAVLDICAHLLCNRLGIGIQEESYLRFLAGRALGVGTEALS